jgi:hypothetical protein
VAGINSVTRRRYKEILKVLFTISLDQKTHRVRNAVEVKSNIDYNQFGASRRPNIKKQSLLFW